MFYDSDNFHNLEAGLKATWLNQQLRTQNLSNLETPHYKAKNLVFSQVLDASKADLKAGGKYYQYQIKSYDTDVRTDENNVNAEIESIELYKAQAQYSILLDKVKGQFDNFNYVLSNGPK